MKEGVHETETGELKLQQPANRVGLRQTRVAEDGNLKNNVKKGLALPSNSGRRA
jgi:hypothetical protein